MQGYIPQYILERGASAREYRRRSSTISRTSNSSAYSSSMSPGDDVVSNSDQRPGEDVASIYGINNLTTYTINDGSKNLFSQATSLDGGADDNAAMRENVEVRSGRFGLARPRLVHSSQIGTHN
ncbi:hypothetical protein EV175_004433 [Coemansia sp. RSA 1933]|nr:hypothetical protein EV175_004433 [Coemansia sp. RSA 1933]